MAEPYTMPSPMAPLVDPQNGAITQIWLGLMREFAKGLKAERAPKRIEPFWLSAADLADDTKFVQAGTTAGLGVGDYLGWAICNGNNGTPIVDGTFPRWSVAGHDAAGASGGSDNSTHTHDIDHNHPSAAAAATSTTPGDTGTENAHTHSINHTHPYADYTPGGAYYAIPNPAFIGSSGAGSAHSHTSAAHTHDVDLPALGATDSGPASSTENRPSFKSWVPLMRTS